MKVCLGPVAPVLAQIKVPVRQLSQRGRPSSPRSIQASPCSLKSNFQLAASRESFPLSQTTVWPLPGGLIIAALSSKPASRAISLQSAMTESDIIFSECSITQRLKAPGEGLTKPRILGPCTGNCFSPLYKSCWVPAGIVVNSQIKLLIGRSVKGLIKRQSRELETNRKSTGAGLGGGQTASCTGVLREEDPGGGELEGEMLCLVTLHTL